MKAVLWTDVFQVCMMIAGLLAILIKGGLVVDGFGPAWDSAVRTNRDILTEYVTCLSAYLHICLSACIPSCLLTCLSACIHMAACMPAC